MAITINNASSGQIEGTQSSLTFEHIVNFGSNKILIVGVAVQIDAGDVPDVTGVTYNSVALTKIAEKIYLIYESVELWYLLNPDEGTHNVVVTLASATDKGIGAGAITIDGAKQQAPEVNNTANGNSTTASVSITTLTDNAWIIDAVATRDSTNDMTAGENQTERHEVCSCTTG